MNKYETVILLSEKSTKEQRYEVIQKIENYIINNGEIMETNDLGHKRLAYQIKDNTHAYYYVIQFEAKPTAIAELERIYRISDEVIKFIVVRIED